MKNLFAKKTTVAVVFFLLGLATMWGIQTVFELKHQADRARRMMNDPFAQMYQNIFGQQQGPSTEEDGWQLFDIEKRIHQFLLGEKSEKPKEEGGGWLSQIYNLAQGFDLGHMNEREDDLYRYYEFDLKDKKPLEVKISVEENMITMTGAFGSTSSHSRSTFTFHKTFPAPDDVDLKDYQIEQLDGKLVVKFKKIATL